MSQKNTGTAGMLLQCKTRIKLRLVSLPTNCPWVSKSRQALGFCHSLLQPVLSHPHTTKLPLPGESRVCWHNFISTMAIPTQIRQEGKGSPWQSAQMISFIQTGTPPALVLHLTNCGKYFKTNSYNERRLHLWSLIFKKYITQFTSLE